MGKEQKIKWLIVGGLLLAVFISLFRFIFYSPLLSNNESIIGLRNWYQNTLWGTKKTLSIQKPTTNDYKQLYTFQVQKWEDTNLYRFTGTFVKVDTDLNIIQLLGNDGKDYIFRISNQFAIGQTEYKFLNVGYSPKQDKVDLGTLPFTEKSRIDLYWDDNRTLSQILSDYSKDKKIPLNANSNRFFLVRKSDR